MVGRKAPEADQIDGTLEGPFYAPKESPSEAYNIVGTLWNMYRSACQFRLDSSALSKLDHTGSGGPLCRFKGTVGPLIYLVTSKHAVVKARPDVDLICVLVTNHN